MKKLLLSLLLVLPLCGFAQKGMRGIGVSLSPGESFGVDGATICCLNYQKHLSDRARLSCSLGYFGINYSYYEYISDGYEHYVEYCLIAAEIHCFFNQPRRLRPYAIGGLFFGVGDGGECLPDNINGVKLGLGLTYRLGYHWAMNLEAPLYLMEVVGGFHPTLGLTYTF